MLTLIDKINTKIVGVTFKNEDGTNRQDIISSCNEGDNLYLEHYYYKGEDAFRITNCFDECLGNLKKELSAKLVEKYGVDIIESADVEILNITGQDEETLGVNICIKIECLDPIVDDNNYKTSALKEPVLPIQETKEKELHTNNKSDNLSVPTPIHGNDKKNKLVTDKTLKMLNQKYGSKNLKMYSFILKMLFIISTILTLFTLIFSFPFALIFAIISFICFQYSRLYKKASAYSD